jgi:hypothetical protein
VKQVLALVLAQVLAQLPLVQELEPELQQLQ